MLEAILQSIKCNIWTAAFLVPHSSFFFPADVANWQNYVADTDDFLYFKRIWNSVWDCESKFRSWSPIEIPLRWESILIITTDSQSNDHLIDQRVKCKRIGSELES